MRRASPITRMPYSARAPSKPSRPHERCRMSGNAPRGRGRYEHLIAFALEHPWAITASMRTLIAGVLAKRLSGYDDDDEDALTFTRQARDTRAHPVPSGGVVAV